MKYVRCDNSNCKHCKNGISYTPKETVDYGNLVKLCYMQLENKEMF